jgi:hypothetical protein
VVLGNYLVQVPYDLHLYGGRFNAYGVTLLTLTFLWFIVSIVLLKLKPIAGYWSLLLFLVAEFSFYFVNEAVLTIFGYGILYHLLHAKDVIVWIAFAAGDVNLFVSGWYIYYLVKNKQSLFQDAAA